MPPQFAPAALFGEPGGANYGASIAAQEAFERALHGDPPNGDGE